jgi:hypothetical protein
VVGTIGDGATGSCAGPSGRIVFVAREDPNGDGTAMGKSGGNGRAGPGVTIAPARNPITAAPISQEAAGRAERLRVTP